MSIRRSKWARNDERVADEPTGSVDSRTSDLIMDMFRELSRELGVTIVIVTHDAALARQVDRVVAIRDGMTSSELIKQRESEGVVDRAGEEQHEEFAVVDRAGRLQLPREYLDRMQVTDKVRLEWDGGRVIVGSPRIPGERRTVE